MAASTISASFSQKTQPNSSVFLSQKPLNLNFNHCFFNIRHKKALNFTTKCCLNLPLELKSPGGKTLSSVIQNQPGLFYDAVSQELNRVSEDRDAAFTRYILSLGSSEVTLHRRIAKLKEEESQVAVEDVLYTIIMYKFSEIRVPLVPSLSKCLYNGRLEILPSKDWELESIHSFEVLEMVREHLSTVLGLKVGSSVAVNWSTTKIRRHHLSKVYAASILYGYFLKSASLRLHLEHTLSPTHQNVPFDSWAPLPERESCGSQNAVLATPRSTALSQVTRRPEVKMANLRCYVMRFDMVTVEECAKLKSEEAVELISKHCSALYGNGNDDNAENNEMILTSFSSLKRLVLEAVAFGCFLWEAEEHVSSIYKLKGR